MLAAFLYLNLMENKVSINLYCKRKVNILILIRFSIVGGYLLF